MLDVEEFIGVEKWYFKTLVLILRMLNLIRFLGILTTILLLMKKRDFIASKATMKKRKNIV